MKNALRFCWVSILLLTVSCAPKTIELPSYEDRDLRGFLADLRSISDIETTFSVVFEKKDAEIRGDAALDISGGGDMSLRVYSLGFLAMELTSKNDIIKSKPVLDSNKKLILTQGLRNCLFWWDIEDFEVREDAGFYVVTNPTREIRINKRTLLPHRQTIHFEKGKVLTIEYDKPAKKGDIWYQSEIRIELSRYAVTLTIADISFQTLQSTQSTSQSSLSHSKE